ncbi:hypothetical protein IWQ57_005039 [Coemansia nantahalensis]|uniref:Uncharacterized protein n=1 Tax=Coemansia nantahalensis TaxID=2789366 RepID=A0ACC1JPY2_9FUNG|nr:hypothetical protein IWQ57_005039 [Coemansia nantahalensis]
MEVDAPVAANAPGSVDAVATEISALCDSVEGIAGSVIAAQGEQLAVSSDSEQQLINKVTSTFVRLRQLHRELGESKAALGATVASLKQDTDSLALRLENKQREVAYIQHEIESTDTLETIYQDIELVPEAEFMASAPDEFKKDIDSPHKLMLGRLRYEIKQRTVLMEAKDKARAQRDELRKTKRRRIERLEKMDGHLQSYIKSASLLDKMLGAGGSDSSEGDAARQLASTPDDRAKATAGDGGEGRKDAGTPRPSRGGSSRVQ